MNWSSLVQGFTPGITIALIAGLILLVWDIVTPGFSARGISGTLLLLYCCVRMARRSIDSTFWLFAGIVLFVGAAFFFCLRNLNRFHVCDDVGCSGQSIRADASLISASDLSYYIGRQGRALTALNPTGTVDFDGVRLQVYAMKEAIVEGQLIRIVKVEDGVLLVEEAPEGRENDPDEERGSAFLSYENYEKYEICEKRTNQII